MTLLVPELGFLKAETESTYGTDPNSNPLGLIMTEEPDIPTPSSQNVEKNRIRPDGGREAHDVIDENVEFSFQTVVANIPFNDGATPSLRPVLLSSGFSEATSGSTGTNDVQATYTPTRTAIKSATFKFYVKDKDSANQWIKVVITGCRCTFDIDYSIGQEILVNVEGMGQFAKWNDFSDVSGETPSNFHQGEPTFQTQNCTFQQDSTSKVINNWTIDLNNDLNPITDISAASTLSEVRCDNVAQGIAGSFNPLVRSVNASGDVMDDRRTAANVSMNLDLARTDQEWHVTMSNTQIQEDPSFSDDGAHYRYDAPYVVNKGSPELEFQWFASA